MIKEVCHRLKDKRKELGYSIEYTVEKTKLHPSVIKDIEDCNLSKLSPAYFKGFMKIYASFLGVEVNSALEEIELDKTKTSSKKYKKTKKIDSSAIIDRIVQLKKRIPVSSLGKKNIIIIFAAVVFLLGFFAVSRFIARHIFQWLKPESDETEQIESAIPLEQTQQLLVSLTAKKKCFLKVMVDGKVLFEGVLNKGVVETWRANNEIEFKISDGSAVYLQVNGKSIPTLASIRKPIKSLKITPSGISVDK